MTHESAGSWQPRWRWLRRAVLAALLAWTGAYAYTRIATPAARDADPRGYVPLVTHGPQPGDASAQLAELLQRLANPHATHVSEPPPGTAWEASTRGWVDAQRPLEISDATRGAWELAWRPHLAAVVSYLADPNVQTTLDAIDGLRGQSWGLSLDERDANMPTSAGVRQAAYTFCADARRRHAVDADEAGAWARLRTVLWLEASRPQEAVVGGLAAASLQRLVYQELRSTLQEADVPDGVLAAAQTELAAEPDFKATWHRVVQAEAAVGQQLIDMTYTGTRGGNGWFVPNVRVNETKASALPPLWNVTSALYNDRRTVERKLRRMADAIEDAASPPLEEARTALASYPRLSRCDGPVLHAWATMNLERGYLVLLAAEVERQGTLTMLALARYYVAHGVYPQRLQDLSAMGDLPEDPLSPAGFIYQAEADSYTLYSRGFDGDDDGGRIPQRYGDRFRDGDIVMTHGRRPPFFEPGLRPVDANTGGQTASRPTAP